MEPEEWGARFGPVDSDGRRIPLDELPLTVALREGKPAHSSFRIRSAEGDDHDIEVSALPISADEISGALAIFWAREDDAGAGGER